MPTIKFSYIVHPDGTMTGFVEGGPNPEHKVTRHCANRLEWLTLVCDSLIECGPCVAHVELQNGKLHKLSDRMVTQVLEKKMTAEDFVL
jgi:hypothetical protein